MPITNIFDVTQPPDSQAANLIGLDLRNLALNLQQRMAFISGTLALRWNPGADAQPNNWTGLLYFATDTGQVFQWTGAVWSLVVALGSLQSFLALGNNNAIIPANSVIVGSVIDVYVVGTTNGGSSGTAQMGLAFGGSGLISTAVNSTNVPNNTTLAAKLYCISTGIAPNFIYIPTFGSNGQFLTDNTGSPIGAGPTITVTGTGSVIITYTKVVVTL